MKFILLFSMAFLLCTFCTAQSTKDFLVKHNNDTLYGKITLLKKSAGIMANDILYDIAYTDIKYLKCGQKNGEVFYGNFMYYDDNLFQDTYAKEGVTDTLILLDIIDSFGEINLYMGKDNFKKLYFFFKKKADTNPTLLMVGYAFSKSGDIHKPIHLSNLKRIEQKYYANQLKALFKCSKIKEWDYEMLDYNYTSLKKIFKLYEKRCD